MKIELPKKPIGKISDLPFAITTMWYEGGLICPHDDSHKLTGSTRKVYCYECGVWWDRAAMDNKREE